MSEYCLYLKRPELGRCRFRCRKTVPSKHVYGCIQAWGLVFQSTVRIAESVQQTSLVCLVYNLSSKIHLHRSVESTSNSPKLRKLLLYFVTADNTRGLRSVMQSRVGSVFSRHVHLDFNCNSLTFMSGVFLLCNSYGFSSSGIFWIELSSSGMFYVRIKFFWHVSCFNCNDNENILIYWFYWVCSLNDFYKSMDKTPWRWCKCIDICRSAYDV
jgi:hypothetical protein